jgi:pilus assembly protein Flp/PilA
MIDPNAEGPEAMKNQCCTIAAAALRFMRDESGATAIEYALVASGVAVAIASTVFSLGSAVKTNLYGNVAAALK